MCSPIKAHCQEVKSCLIKSQHRENRGKTRTDSDLLLHMEFSTADWHFFGSFHDELAVVC